MTLAWIALAVFAYVVVVMFVLAIVAAAGRADEELDRLQGPRPRARRFVRGVAIEEDDADEIAVRRRRR